MSHIWHVGFAVPDVEAAMAEIGGALGIQWRPLVRFEGRIRDAAGAEHDVATRIAFSTAGPCVVELFDEVPGTPLAPKPGNPFHHLGTWIPGPVEVEKERLVAGGWPCVQASADPTRPLLGAFFEGPSRIMVERSTTAADRPYIRDLFPPDAPFFGRRDDTR